MDYLYSETERCTSGSLSTENMGNFSPKIKTAEEFVPILRWAGSKKKLLPALHSAAPVMFKRYVEPFFGSGVFFLSLGAPPAIVSDINPHLVRTYQEVRSHPLAIWNRLMAMPTDEDFYYRLRERCPSRLNSLDQAARFIYLNRFCFNGVYRTNRMGGFNVSRGTGALGIPPLAVFRSFAKSLKDADLRCQDFEAVMRDVGAGDFLYLDPPYAELGKRDRGEYGPDTFKACDIARLIGAMNAASKRGAKILLSYSASHIDLELLRKWQVKEINVMRNVAGFGSDRKRATEVLVSNYRW